MKLSEKFLQHIWAFKLYNSDFLCDVNGNKIEVLSPGVYNNDSGPDFFNAKIKIEETIWAGNIEIHINSSDWKKHNHNEDKAYDNIILHVVYKNDEKIFRNSGEEIPALEIIFDNKILEKYNQLIENSSSISCSSDLKTIDTFSINSWLNTLLIERIENKTNAVKQILDSTKSNWEETFYILLARSLGTNVNAEPFEILAKSITQTILAKHKSNKFQLEALLFGQAGFLDSDNCEDVYFLNLKKEYLFLKQKYALVSIQNHLWKFLRLRPPSFPTVRISQFADLIFKSNHLFSKIIEIKNIEQIVDLFSVNASEYWQTHFTFGKESEKTIKSIGRTTIDTIIINTIVPILFLYGKEKDNEKITEKALNFIESLPSEKNNITELWTKIGIENKNASISQSLIQLKKEYCDKQKCLDCRIGNKLISNKLK